jgi:hypothetical protein
MKKIAIRRAIDRRNFAGKYSVVKHAGRLDL